MKTKIHVNRHRIQQNRKTGKKSPVLTIKTYRSNIYASEVKINGPCRVIYSPDKPLSCGATVWIETDSEVIPVGSTVTAQKCKAIGSQNAKIA